MAGTDIFLSATSQGELNADLDALTSSSGLLFVLLAGHHGREEGSQNCRRSRQPHQQPRFWRQRHACRPHHVRQLPRGCRSTP